MVIGHFSPLSSQSVLPSSPFQSDYDVSYRLFQVCFFQKGMGVCVVDLFFFHRRILLSPPFFFLLAFGRASRFFFPFFSPLFVHGHRRSLSFFLREIGGPHTSSFSTRKPAESSCTRPYFRFAVGQEDFESFLYTPFFLPRESGSGRFRCVEGQPPL